MDAAPPSHGEQPGRSDESRLATAEHPLPMSRAAPPGNQVLVTGGEGFLGSHLIPRLLSRRHLVRATFRDPDGPGRRVAPGIDWREVDLGRAEDVDGVAEECDVVVHLAGAFSASGGHSLARVHGTGTRHLIQEAERSGVGRLVHVSALGARPGDADYFGTKFDAETAVISSKIPSVILRPSVIYGPGDRFTTTIVQVLRRLPVFPLPGGGRFPVQPLAVEDMVEALSQCVERDDLENREFELAGPERLTLREVVSFIAELTQCRRPIVTLPEGLALSAAGLAHRLGLPGPFTPDQLAIFATNNVVSSDENPLLDVFLLKPMPFREALADYLDASA